MTVSDTISGRGSVALQTRLEGDTAWTTQAVQRLSPTPRKLTWTLPKYRVPDARDAFSYRLIVRDGKRERVLYPGREFRGPMLPASVPEFSPAVEGFTLTYFLLDPRAARVTLQVWDPVVGVNLFGGGRWVTVFTRQHVGGQAGRVTETIPSPFDPFDVGRASSYRFLVSYGAAPIAWRESALFAVSGTSWLTYATVAALLLLVGGSSAMLWPLLRSRARLQEELRLAEVRSQARQRGMTLLANKIGHEAEAWMASIRWLNALLRREVAADSRAAEYVSELEQAADQLGSYLLRLKEYGRPPSPTRAPIRVADALRTARLRAEPVLQSTGVEVRERRLTDAWLLGDEGEIVAALGNLIQNAAEAMANADRRYLGLTVRNGEPGRAVIEIEDTGHGIADEIADTLFDPFRSTRGEGRGLGLAIARKNLEAHRGTIACRREPHGGATFLVTLPTVREAETDTASLLAGQREPTPSGPALETADQKHR